MPGTKQSLVQAEKNRSPNLFAFLTTMAAKSTPATQPEASQNGKKNVKAEKPVANKQDADDEAEDEPVEKGAKGEAVKDMRNVTRYFEEQAERSVDADKIQKV
jgi:hypothetical protein